ncbi:hypothetical protein AAFF_G00115610 [Aldrovandia affinis]|uniref:Uncharacterized protein n=1 Tax=Aldrovandia affinis TaxID=143900 RepID=A0AAD7WAR1_9TELE|nr:hypothetical protein AAFF_G00115610 [Aldrovandia affinis]
MPSTSVGRAMKYSAVWGMLSSDSVPPLWLVQPFGNILELVKLIAICTLCFKEATYIHQEAESGERGGGDQGH